MIFTDNMQKFDKSALWSLVKWSAAAKRRGNLAYYIAERTRLAKLAAERNDSEGWGKSMLHWPKKFWASGEERDASSGFYAGRGGA